MSEGRLFEALGSSFPAYYVAISLEGKVLSMNPVMLNALGYDLDEVLGLDYVATFIPEDDRAFLRALFADQSRVEKTINENRILARNGAVRWCEWHGTPVLKDGRVAYFFGLGIDITERKQEAASRRRTEASLRTLLDTIPDLVWLKSPEGRYLECNRKFERLYGMSRQDLLGRTDYDFVATHLADLYRANDQATIAAGKPVLHEEEVTYADDGHYELLESIKTPVRDDDGNLLGVLGIGRDITERKRIETELQRSRAGLAALIESTRDLIWSVDRQYCLTTFNSVLDEHFRKNYGTHAFLGAAPADLLPADRAEAWPALYDRAMTQGPYQMELSLPDGRTLELMFHPIHGGKAVEGVSVFGKDITEHRLAEEQIRASELRYRHLVDHAPIGVFRRALDGRYDYVNNGTLKQFECATRETFDRFYGALGNRWAHPERHEQFKDLVQSTGQALGFEVEVHLVSGKTKWFLLYAFQEETEGLINGFSVDVTELKVAEAERAGILEQLHQSQKIDAIGQLAGGVAHDFNNLLGGIMGAAELLQRSAADVPEAKQRSYAGMIIEASKRAADLTSKLLTFSRKGTKDFAPVDILRVVEDTAEILRRTIDKHINIAVEATPTPRTVTGDASMLGNVFMNLGINASHAMPDGGALLFKVRSLTLDQYYCMASPYTISPGQYVEIQVIDTGCGISPDVQKRIFEPFFTTKSPGQGTGLGLSVVHGTIQDHHGAIHLYSELGVGTAFHIYLPLTDDASVQVHHEETILEGTGNILVVEDEEILRTVTQTMLEGLGYRVYTANNGWEGVALFKALHADLGLVILDMIMPIMGGRQAFDLMRALDDQVPVLLSSGFSKDEDLAGMMRHGLQGFIRKPCPLVELSKTVAQTIRRNFREAGLPGGQT